MRVGRGVCRIGACYSFQHYPTVVCRQTQRAKLVERPTQRHRACPADSAVGGTQPGQPAVVGWGQYRSPRLRAYCKRNETGCDRRTGPAGRPSSPSVPVPGISWRTCERGIGLMVSHTTGQLDHCDLCRKRCACRLQPGYDGRVMIECLVTQWLGSPGGWDASRRREQVLCAPRDATQQSDVIPGSNRGFHLVCSLQRTFTSKSD